MYLETYIGQMSAYNNMYSVYKAVSITTQLSSVKIMTKYKELLYG